MNDRIDKAAILELVSAFDVAHKLWQTVDGEDEARLNECPKCGRGREHFSINSRLFHCFRCKLKGDAIALFAFLAGLEGQPFPAVLDRMAAEFGITPETLTPEELERRKAERRVREEEQRAIKAEKRRIAIGHVPSGWALSPARHARGERYLRDRGLARLIGRDDLVRFDTDGNPRILIHDFDDRPVNIITRLITPKDRKHDSRKDCPTLGTFGRVSRIADTTGIVFLTEGVFDYLTGVLLFEPHGGVVLGAQGASNLPKIATAIAPVVAAKQERDCRLCFVVHEDDRGREETDAAIDIAVAAGVAFDPAIDLFNLGGTATDLNEALLAGAGDCREYV